MNSTLREDADAIIRASLNAVLPDEAVRRALEAFRPGGAGLFHLRTGPCHCGKVPAEPVGTGKGFTGAGDAQSAGQRDHKDHRQRAPTLRGGGRSLPGAGL